MTHRRLIQAIGLFALIVLAARYINWHTRHVIDDVLIALILFFLVFLHIGGRHLRGAAADFIRNFLISIRNFLMQYQPPARAILLAVLLLPLAYFLGKIGKNFDGILTVAGLAAFHAASLLWALSGRGIKPAATTNLFIRLILLSLMVSGSSPSAEPDQNAALVACTIILVIEIAIFIPSISALIEAWTSRPLIWFVFWIDVTALAAASWWIVSWSRHPGFCC
jgi:hypothetical protein